MKIRPVLAALAALAASLAYAQSSGAELPPPETAPQVLVGPQMRQLALPLSDATKDALRTRQWATAAKLLLAMKPETLVGAHKGDWAFLVAYSLSHSDQAKAALPYLGLIDGADCVPKAYGMLTKAEVWRATDAPEQALAALATVPKESSAWPRAAVQQAEILRDLGRTKDAWAIYDGLAALPDRSAGQSMALLALADRAGTGSPEAYALLRRIWAEYPHSDEAVEATKRLAAYPTLTATWQQVGTRAEHLMDDSDYAGAILETGRRLTEVAAADPSVDACRFTYVRGRSLYRTNKLTESIAAFGDVGERCKGVAEGDYGAKSMFLVGQAQFRLNQYPESAATNIRLAELYPTSSFADDGLTQAGFALTEADDLEGARKVWIRALDEQPNGDTVPEASFRLAFAYYLEGRPDDARAVADKLAKLPLGAGWVDVAAGRYWSARWALYPDVAHPDAEVADPARKQAAIDGWRTLCEDMPHSFYAIEAYARLVEVAPDVAKKLATRAPDRDVGDKDVPWQVRLAFYDDPHVRAGVDLARLGLATEARAEWDTLDANTFTGDEMAWLVELRIADNDWLKTHDEMRKWLITHPPGTLGDRQPEILRIAYPDRYWPEVQKNAQGYSYDPRLFHALCREESNFNVHIVSHAGARGLSQLMPATAREVGGWLKVPVTTEQLDDPDFNARLGARYLEAMHKQVKGSPYLALAGYNAGAGRVSQWIGEWGNVPTDEYVERIPFRETRAYVKRVMGSWQTMRWQFDDGDAFYDLSAFNHHARKEDVTTP
jgi:soluble lytic murein transglycosylase